MISILIPFYNEEESLPLLHDEIVGNMAKLKREYEIIYIDDGSIDQSFLAIRDISKNDTHVTIIANRKRLGKGEALRKGIEKARGEILIFMDADLQDNPSDLAHFLKKMDEGYHLVNGIRKKRKDSLIVRLYSAIANTFLNRVMKSPFTDINCGFKAIDKEIFKEIYLYGNNFRFLPLAAYYKGFRVAEIPVDNRDRRYGVSKFGWKKLYIGMIDTMTAYFIFQFAEKPLHFFGTIGLVFFSLGFIISVYLAIERIFFNVLLYRRPLLQFGTLFIIIGIQIAMTGIIGELIVYLEKRKQ